MQDLIANNQKAVDDTTFEAELLAKEGIQVVAGSKFGPMGKNHIRINCATSEELLEDGINRIIQFLNSA